MRYDDAVPLVEQMRERSEETRERWLRDLLDDLRRRCEAERRHGHHVKAGLIQSKGAAGRGWRSR